MRWTVGLAYGMALTGFSRCNFAYRLITEGEWPILAGSRVEPQVDSEPNILDRYRIFTKATGMRPRDFLIEVFKMFCRALDVSEIRAVSNLNHPQRQKVSDIKLSYDQVWRERGGVYDGNGFLFYRSAAMLISIYLQREGEPIASVTRY